MKIVAPIQISDSQLIASNIPPTIVQEFDPGYPGGYDVGDIVSSETTHRIYESVAGGNTVDPSSSLFNAEGVQVWIDLGATNRWSMFDGQSRKSSRNADTIDVTIAPGQLYNAVALLNIEAAYVDIIVTDSQDGVVYEESIETFSLDGINDFYTWCFNPIQRVDTIARTDLPAYPNATLRVILNDTNSTVVIGELIAGNQKEIGVTTTGTSVGIQDYSRKEVDVFGNASLVQRPFNDTASYMIHMNNNNIDSSKKFLAANRAKPLVFIGSDQYSATVVYGFYRDFDITIAYPNYSDMVMDVEELAGADAIRVYQLVTPEVLAPTDSATDVQETATLRCSAFETLPNGIASHLSTTWEIYSDATLQTLVWSATVTDTELEATNVPENVLSVSTIYYVRCQQTTADGDDTPWSAAVAFTTAAIFPDYQIGDNVDGDIVFYLDTATSELLLCAPSSRRSVQAWALWGTDVDGIADTRPDPNTGKQNTDILTAPPYSTSVDAYGRQGSPAARFCRNNGYDLPSVDETELISANRQIIDDNDQSGSSRSLARIAAGTAYGSNNRNIISSTEQNQPAVTGVTPGRYAKIWNLDTNQESSILKHDRAWVVPVRRIPANQ